MTVELRPGVVAFPGPWGDASIQPDTPRPMGSAVHALYLLDHGRTNEAIGIVDGILARGHDFDGALFLPYPDDIDRNIGRIDAPWYSGAGNGLMLTATIRLFDTTGEARYREAADRLHAAFAIEGEPFSIVHREGGHLWIDWANFADPDPVLNTHIFGIFGLYEYWELTGHGEPIITEAIQTVGAEVHRFVPLTGPRSWYDLRQRWRADDHYHGIIAPQIDVLAEMAGAECLRHAAEAFR